MGQEMFNAEIYAPYAGCVDDNTKENKKQIKKSAIEIKEETKENKNG